MEGKQWVKLLFTDVQNAAELKSMVIKGQLECALVKASMVLDEFQLDVAVNKALHSQAGKKMITRTVFAEILFNLSPSKNITESLKKFGVNDGDRELVAVVLDDKNVPAVTSNVKGQQCSLDKLEHYADKDVLKKLFKVTDKELQVTSLVGSIVSRIAVKELL